MDIVVRPLNGVAVATILAEDLDAGNADDFKRDIGPVIDAYPRLVLDLSRLRFVDSSGIGAFISCLRKLNAAGGDLKLCGLTPPVRAVFELVRMHRVFDIFDTQEWAVQALEATATK
jgi:anti-sigma B factor antagonist